MSYKQALSNDINPFRLDKPKEILLVFTDLPKSCGRFYGLRPGFGHCFMLLHFADNQWWVIDPLFHGIEHARLQWSDPDENLLEKAQLLSLLEAKGCRVIAVDSMVNKRFGKSQTKGFKRFGRCQLGFQASMISFGVFSCVTLIKRTLGIRQPMIITPYQLFRFLIEQK